jgi:hypothetical protein
MSVSGADIAKAVNSLWNSSDLDDQFTAFWTATEIASDTVLNDGEATPGNAFPYCVFTVDPGSTITRMSSSTENRKRQTRQVPLIFHVHAQPEGALTAKEVAANMAEEILKIYGGHPTVVPTDLVLDNGNFLISQIITDYGVRTEDDVYQWVINYMLVVDVPVAV